MSLMKGKKGLIMGVANEKSIAWGIAKACFEAGADMAFSYQGEALKKRVGPLAEKVGSDFLIECDVSDNSSILKLFAEKTGQSIEDLRVPTMRPPVEPIPLGWLAVEDE